MNSIVDANFIHVQVLRIEDCPINDRHFSEILSHLQSLYEHKNVKVIYEIDITNYFDFLTSKTTQEERQHYHFQTWRFR